MPLKKARRKALTAIPVSTLGTVPAVFAGHARPWGAGRVNMPHAIHTTRLDTLDSDDPTCRDFVRHGRGADPVSRLLDDDVIVRGGGIGGSGAVALGGVATRRGTRPC